MSLGAGLLEGFFEEGPVVFGFVGVGAGEGEQGAVKARRLAEVGGDGDGVTGAGVSAGEEFAAEVGITEERGGGEGLEVERGLVVVELADEEVAAVDGGVAEEGVTGELHGTLAVHGAMALVRVRVAVRQVGRPGRGCLLFDLEEERVGAGLAVGVLEVDAVVAQADGAGADDLEGDVDGRVLREEVAALGLEGRGVGRESGEDGRSFFGGQWREEWRVGAEAAGSLRG